jgi:hypothetical protein
VAELLHLSWDAISGGPEIAFRKFVLFGSDFLNASDIRLRAFKRTAESSGFARVERVSFAMWRSCRGLEAKSS